MCVFEIIIITIGAADCLNVLQQLKKKQRPKTLWGRQTSEEVRAHGGPTFEGEVERESWLIA